MERTQVIDNIRQVAARILPKGSMLYLYGSRARGDAHEDSDWDLLLLLNNEGDSDENFRRYAYPIIVRGYDLWQCTHLLEGRMVQRPAQHVLLQR